MIESNKWMSEWMNEKEIIKNKLVKSDDDQDDVVSKTMLSETKKERSQSSEHSPNTHIYKFYYYSYVPLPFDNWLDLATK